MAAINSSIMNKYLVIGFLICLNTAECVQAQWSKKDSIWLANILSGKDTIRLNPEFQKAIQSGTLINNDKPGQHMQMAPASIPFSKDFSEYIHKEDTTENRKISLKDLPPSVFMKYGPGYIDEPWSFKLTREYFKREFGQSTGVPTGISGLSFDGLLRSAFQPSYREKRKNVKRAETWQNYNNLPTPDVISKRKKFLNEQKDSLALETKRDSL